MPEHKQVIVMRKDLNMRKGKMVAQGAHASLKALLDVAIPQTIYPKESMFGLSYLLGKNYKCIPLDENIQPWLEGKFTKVCVSVDNEADLLKIHLKAKEAGILTALIKDAGLTEFGGVPTYTCCAVGPGLASKIDEITGDLKLL